MKAIGQRKCERLAFRLQKPTRRLRSQGVNASIDISDCTSPVRLVAGLLNIEALEWVSGNSPFIYMHV